MRIGSRDFYTPLLCTWLWREPCNWHVEVGGALVFGIRWLHFLTPLDGWWREKHEWELNRGLFVEFLMGFEACEFFFSTVEKHLELNYFTKLVDCLERVHSLVSKHCIWQFCIKRIDCFVGPTAADLKRVYRHLKTSIDWNAFPNRHVCLHLSGLPNDHMCAPIYDHYWALLNQQTVHVRHRTLQLGHSFANKLVSH